MKMSPSPGGGRGHCAGGGDADHALQRTGPDCDHGGDSTGRVEAAGGGPGVGPERPADAAGAALRPGGAAMRGRCIGDGVGPVWGASRPPCAPGLWPGIRSGMDTLSRRWRGGFAGGRRAGGGSRDVGAAAFGRRGAEVGAAPAVAEAQVLFWGDAAVG